MFQVDLIPSQAAASRSLQYPFCLLYHTVTGMGCGANSVKSIVHVTMSKKLPVPGSQDFMMY